MRVITPLSQKSSNTKQNHTASTPKFQSTLSPLKSTLNFHQNHRTAKQKSTNFSTQYDNLLQSIDQFCESIQQKAYGNIRQTCQLLKKYKILNQFKQCIDKHWKKTGEYILQYLKIDKSLIKRYSQSKLKFIEYSDMIGSCQNSQQLAHVLDFLQNSVDAKIINNRVRLARNIEGEMNTQYQNLKQFREKIEDQSQFIKDYSVKIIQLVTDFSESGKKYQEQADKKANTKAYFQLRDQIQNKLNSSYTQLSNIKVNQENTQNLQPNHPKNVTNNSHKNDNKFETSMSTELTQMNSQFSSQHENSMKQSQNAKVIKRNKSNTSKLSAIHNKRMEESGMWIEKILNLYKNY